MTTYFNENHEWNTHWEFDRCSPNYREPSKDWVYVGDYNEEVYYKFIYILDFYETRGLYYRFKDIKEYKEFLDTLK